MKTIGYIVLSYVVGFILTFIAIHVIDNYMSEDERIKENELKLVISTSLLWPYYWILGIIVGGYELLKLFSKKLKIKKKNNGSNKRTSESVD